jgi:hypothetical protein
MKILGLILACFLLASNSFAALIFKTTKEIKSDGKIFVELATVDTSKFKQIRIGVIQVSGETGSVGSFINIDAIEDNDLIQIGGFNVYEFNAGKSQILETFSNKIKISAQNSGTYKVFVWAQ